MTFAVAGISTANTATKATPSSSTVKYLHAIPAGTGTMTDGPHISSEVCLSIWHDKLFPSRCGIVRGVCRETDWKTSMAQPLGEFCGSVALPALVIAEASKPAAEVFS